MTKDEALRLALEELEADRNWHQFSDRTGTYKDSYKYNRNAAAIAAIEAALAAPKPLSKTLDHTKWENDLKPGSVMGNFDENYPPLTDADIEELVGFPNTDIASNHYYRLCRAIERRVRGEKV